MREAIKVLSVVVLAIAVIVTALAWIDDRPNQTTWLLRTIPIAVAVASVIVFLSMHFKKDLAPDLLHRNFGGYFERDGFCFVVFPDAEDGRCILRIFFQNRFERECEARIALRPSKLVGFKGPPILKIAVACPGAAFGVVERAVALPEELQGRLVSLDVGADTTYPHGKGAMVRFRDALVLRSDVNFVDNFATATSIVGLVTGRITFHRPAHVKARMPRDVATLLADDEQQRMEILWQPGSPAAEAVATGPANLS
ncbi:hypothetical protein [Lacipirellula sp.]|uniref:hypothetical protein n=1 Tax=Lacipirellula sp. TaxID=2691419 RepID=UPI003D0FC2CC